MSTQSNVSISRTTQFFTFPFRKRRKRYTLNPPENVQQVIYLGNVLTPLAKGEECVQKPLALIWRTYRSRQRCELRMKLTVTRFGLRAESQQQGITEYWAHRITYCLAPRDYPRVFCWVYKHEGRRMKPELRCHAVLCKRSSDPLEITLSLKRNLQTALQEYRREKLFLQNSRLSAQAVGKISTLPRRKLLLQTGTMNFRPSVSRSNSATQLLAIDEEDEMVEDETQDGLSDLDSLCYPDECHDEECSSNSLISSVSDELSMMHCGDLESCAKVDDDEAMVSGKATVSTTSGTSSIVSDDMEFWDDDAQPRTPIINRITSASGGLPLHPLVTHQMTSSINIDDQNGVLAWKYPEKDKDSVSEESGYHDACNSDDEAHCELDESQYDEQVTAL